MKLYNSYSNQVEEFVPISENEVKMYVCGPTVYDFAHLGHARCYITWDMLVRYLRFKGYNVTYARNITDVDDKIINKAIAQNTTCEEISQKYSKEFENSLNALNCLKPDIEPLATKTIGDMIALIKKLESKGYAYNIDGDVFFRVEKYKNYGKLSNQKIEDLTAGARIEADERKESPLDFALWKSAKEGEISWKSPWGEGRPGWHLECSAMINKVFKGEMIDIHAGGADLMFPHHENEIAQSCAAFEHDFVKYWLHNGFVTINEEKMSKSLNNFITINKLLESYDSNTIRLFILTNHYRMPVGFNDEALKSAQNGAKRIKNAIEEATNALPQKTTPTTPKDNEYVKKFEEAMDNDFNTSKALAVIFELVSEINRAKNEQNEQKMAENLSILLGLTEVLGFNFDIKKAINYKEANNALKAIIESNKEIKEAIIKENLSEKEDKEAFETQLNAIINSRSLARTNKNWDYSDLVRDELLKIGITLKDTKEGTSWSFE